MTYKTNLESTLLTKHSLHVVLRCRANRITSVLLQSTCCAVGLDTGGGG